MKGKYVKPFLKREVAIGIRHYEKPDCLFWIYGVLIEADERNATLSNDGKFREIPYTDILEIHEQAVN